MEELRKSLEDAKSQSEEEAKEREEELKQQLESKQEELEKARSDHDAKVKELEVSQMPAFKRVMRCERDGTGGESGG